MDYKKDSGIQSVSKFSQVHFLKKTIQILVSIYVFSLFFSQPSLLSYLDHYISTFSIKLFHYNTERNYIFLLFNGILAVILKNSGLISMSPKNSSYEDSEKEKNHHLPEVSDAEISRRKTEVTAKAVKKAEEHGRQNGILATVKRGEEISERETEFTKGAEVEEDERQSSTPAKDGMNGLQIQEVLNDEDQEEEEEHGLMSTDELNRKCDEFIKKMREGIKVEIQQIVMG